MTPRLIVEQRITAFVNKYSVHTANPDGSKGNLVAFAQQKRLAFKEKVTFYSDEANSQVAFTFRAEKLLDVHGRYFVEDAEGKLVGSFKKDYTKSLINSTWTILDANDQPKLVISESNQLLAILRRFVGFIPIVGGLFEIVIMFLRYHFVFADAATKQPVGRYQKTTLIRDHYALSMTDEAYASQDWRVLAAMAVGLDALQSR
jgi:hypothetical protein